MRSTKRSISVHRAVLEALEQRWLLSLAAPATYGAGDAPQAVATADLNGDGRSDVVIGNANAGTVSVLLATATGAMQAAQQYPAGAGGARSVAVGDVNGDGKRDVVASTGTGASVLIGNGNGTFQAPSGVVLPGQLPPGYTGTTPLPQTGASVAVGDVNADGKIDLVVGGYTTHDELYYGYYPRQVFTPYVNVLLGNGNGTFGAANTYLQSGGWVDRLVLADFNNDDKLDVLAGSYGAMLWLGNGNGTLAAPAYVDPYGVPAVGDFDNDGKLDLAVGSGTTVSIHKGSGTGTFQYVRNLDVGTLVPGRGVGGNVRSLVTGDVDNDGKLDLVAHTQRTVYASYGYYGGYDPTTTDYTKVLLGFGDANFSPPITSTVRSYDSFGSGGNGAALGDVNGDGRPDVIATEPSLDVATVQLNQGGWVAPVAVSIGDATVTEGHAGTVNAVVNVTLDHAVSFTVSVPYTTTDGTATVAGGDYFATSGTLTFAPGETSKPVTVQVRGDRVGELDEQLHVTLGEPTNAVVVDPDGRGTVTITEDEPGLSLSNNASVTEGNSGTTALVITATLTAAYDVPVTFVYATQGGSATSGLDFVAATGTVTFQPGQTSRPISVAVKGDTIPEGVEAVYVTASNVSGALWDGSFGSGSIIDDDADAAVVIRDLARAEGNAGQTSFAFTLTRLTPSERESYVYFTTSNGSASSSGGNRDYFPVTSGNGTVYFAPGQVNALATVHVYGDTRNESDETFFVNLTGGYQVNIADAQAVGTILNDESRGKTWVGPATGGNWGTAANWSPSGVPTATSLVTISGAAVTLASSATVAELSLDNYATLTMAPNGNRVLRTGALFMTVGAGLEGATLDLGDNDLIVDYVGTAPGSSPIGAWNGLPNGSTYDYYDGIQGLVAYGRSHPGWSAAGIVSTRPDALGGLTTLGVREAGDVLGISGAQTGLFAGQTVDATTILVKYTYDGDANLDGRVDADDYGGIDFNVLLPRATDWYNGDFNLDGKIDADDYGVIDFTILAQGVRL